MTTDAGNIASGSDGASPAERVRAACIAAALRAYEEAGMSGLCAEGRWELAVQAMRTVALEPLQREGAPSD